MPDFNKVILMGRLTRDPETSYTPKGTAVAKISLAINRYYTVDDKKHEETTFVDVELWGRQAELANEYVKKGQPLHIEGRLKLDTWDDKETGQKRSKMKVVGESIQFLVPKGDEPDDDPPPRQQRQQFKPSQQQRTGKPAQSQKPPANPAAGLFDDEIDEDDVPF